jgi:hypothetical protein
VSTLEPATERGIREDVERCRTRAAGSPQAFSAALWDYLTGWALTPADDAELAAVVRLLLKAADGSEPR